MFEKMSDSHGEDRLSRISTIWTLVRQAHGDESRLISAARTRMIERYAGAVYRYLLAVLRDRDAADEVFQEFALKLVAGAFHNADQTRGRFRDYVKVSILRLIADHCRQRQQEARLRGTGSPVDAEPAEAPDGVDPIREADFLASCREELLGRAWQMLRELEGQSGQLLFTVLDYRARHPGKRSNQIAEELNDRRVSDRPLTATAVRKTLQRARVQFADRLLDEVVSTLDHPSPDEIEQELIDLGLHAYCAQAWHRRYGIRNGPPPAPGAPAPGAR